MNARSASDPARSSPHAAPGDAPQQDTPAGIERVDPELRRPLLRFREALGPRGFLELTDFSSRRAAHERLGVLAASRMAGSGSVERETLELSTGLHRPDLQVRVYRPRDAPRERHTAAGVLYLHGGGLVMGGIEADDGYAAAVAEQTGAVTVSVGYRLAPEHPYPAALDDCVDAFTWMTSPSGPQEVDPDRVAVVGASAGGGLAVSLALALRDLAVRTPRALLLAAPMLDDRPAPRTNHVELGVWDREHDEQSWAAVLGDRAGGGDVPALAAPARAPGYRGLPPVHLDVGSLDLFLHEDLELARRLADDGVSTALHVVPGAYHGFDQLAPRAEASLLVAAERTRFLRRLLAARP